MSLFSFIKPEYLERLTDEEKRLLKREGELLYEYKEVFGKKLAKKTFLSATMENLNEIKDFLKHFEHLVAEEEGIEHHMRKIEFKCKNTLLKITEREHIDDETKNRLQDLAIFIEKLEENLNEQQRLLRQSMKNSFKFLSGVKNEIVILIDKEKELLLGEESVYKKILYSITFDRRLEETKRDHYGRAVRTQEFKKHGFRRGGRYYLRDFSGDRLVPTFIYTQQMDRIIRDKRLADSTFRSMSAVPDYIIIFKIIKTESFSEPMPQRVHAVVQVGFGQDTEIEVTDVIIPK